MAEEKQQENSALTTALPVTVVLAILAGLLFTSLSPYQDERPSNRPVQARYDTAQDVDARLWQDPFAAVDSASEEMPAEKVIIEVSHNGKALQLEATRPVVKQPSYGPDQIYKGDPVTAKDEVTVLAVTLPGGPYQEAAEARMRRRYAVLSALANQGATPEDEQHIGYFHPADKGMNLQKRVSFEWWPLLDEKKKVLLLWVDESSLLNYPAAKVRELLLQASCQGELTKGIAFDYAVVGPNTSTLLRDMLKEVEDAGNRNPVSKCAGKPPFKSPLGKINGHNIVYFSAGATASDEGLLKESIKQAIDGGETVSDYLRDQGVTLYRTTATDSKVMGILVDELYVRHVKAHYLDIKQWLLEKLGFPHEEQEDHIVILSEWDTFYGRAMPKAFEEGWGTIDGKDKNGETKVHVYGNMRGLDGKLPDQGDKSGGAAEKKSGNQDKTNADALIEFPEGQNQKDYLRRLTASILELDQYLMDEDNKKGIAAIGVLGSDMHDKFLILEALRQHFPHKLFFTTDLDAAYNHPAKWPQTHNLLVASAFDLKLRNELQDKIPLFRDSYQTAFFLAVQMALNDEKCIAVQRFGETLDEHFPDSQFFSTDPVAAYSHAATYLQKQNQRKADAYDLNLQVKSPSFRDSYQIAPKEGSCISDLIGIPLPRLFEIGRSRPVSLPTSNDKVSVKYPDDSKKPKCSWIDLSACNSVQPRIFAFSQLDALKGSVIIVCILMILYLISWRIRKVVNSTFEDCWKLLYYVICVLLTYYLMISGWNYYITQPDAEPFYWLEGVSAWPSQLLRLLVVLFAGGFFLWGRGQIKKMQKDLQAQREMWGASTFALPAEQTQLGSCDVLFVGSWEDDKEVKTVSPDNLWKKYLGYCRQKKFRLTGSLLRGLTHGAVFLILAALVIFQSGFPNTPARGDFALYMNRGILIAAVPATIFLTMWVVEHARLCERLITHLSAKPSRWNNIARYWAIRYNKVAPECVNDWLDIQLVARLTASMQPLIFGPVVCIALLVLARSPALDDWNMPWGLGMVLLVMLLYAISAEVWLQRGARRARSEAIKHLTGKISAQRNLNLPDDVVIKRIEVEIERIQALREGAFRPWYELPLLRPFGGLGTLVIALQYLAGVWERGTF